MIGFISILVGRNFRQLCSWRRYYRGNGQPCCSHIYKFTLGLWQTYQTMLEVVFPFLSSKLFTNRYWYRRIISIQDNFSPLVARASSDCKFLFFLGSLLVQFLHSYLIFLIVAQSAFVIIASG